MSGVPFESLRMMLTEHRRERIDFVTRHRWKSLTVVVVLLGLFAFVAGVVLIVSGFATRQFAQTMGRGSAVV